MIDNRNQFSDNFFDSGENVAERYASYDAERFYPAFNSMSKAIKRLIPCNKILDIGCAKGFFVDVLRKKGYDAYGTDISQYAVNQSPVDIKSFLSVCDLNSEVLPFSDSSFDLIICMGTLEYIENQSHALNEINRVLKSGGILLMTTLNSVPDGDELRKFAKTEEEWQTIFNKLDFRSNKVLATRVISKYVRKIILYDLGKALRHSKERNIKLIAAKLLFNTIAKYLLIEYLYNKQIKSGYLMLSYRKTEYGK